MPEIHIGGSTFLWPGGTSGGNGSGQCVGWGQCIEEGFVLLPFYCILFYFIFYFWKVLYPVRVILSYLSFLGMVTT